MSVVNKLSFLSLLLEIGRLELEKYLDAIEQAANGRELKL